MPSGTELLELIGLMVMGLVIATVISTTWLRQAVAWVGLSVPRYLRASLIMLMGTVATLALSILARGLVYGAMVVADKSGAFNRGGTVEDVTALLIVLLHAVGVPLVLGAVLSGLLPTTWRRATIVAVLIVLLWLGTYLLFLAMWEVGEAIMDERFSIPGLPSLLSLPLRRMLL